MRIFNWFRKSAECPVHVDDKAWIERRLTWLVEQFGRERFVSVQTILPTKDFYPTKYAPNEENLEDLLARTCRYMDVGRDRVELFVYEDEELRHPGIWEDAKAGLYAAGDRPETVRVGVESSLMDDPIALVATMAHELALVHLLGEGRIPVDAEDREPLADLLTIFLGMGIFGANSVVHESTWAAGHWSGWTVGRRGYLTMPMYGYAFALCAWARRESYPSWATHLRLDVRTAMEASYRFLKETRNSGFGLG